MNKEIYLKMVEQSDLVNHNGVIMLDKSFPEIDPRAMDKITFQLLLNLSAVATPVERAEALEHMSKTLLKVAKAQREDHEKQLEEKQKRWIETYYHITVELQWYRDRVNSPAQFADYAVVGNVNSIESSGGVTAWQSHAEFLTNQFELRYRNETWDDLDYYETIDNFVSEMMHA